MSKKNIGATLALYPCPVIVVGAMVNDKPTWTLVAHAGTMAHSHLMVSLVQAHYINQGIRKNKKLSVNVIDESWLKDADRMGTISGNKMEMVIMSWNILIISSARFLQPMRMKLC